MEKKVEVSRLAKIPAWTMALFIFVLSIISAFVLEHVTIPGHSTLGIIGFIFYIVFIPVASFIITMIHPKSVRFTPFVCNPVALLGTIFHPLAWTTLLEYLFWVSSLVLTILGAIVGAKMGRRKINQAE